MTVNDDINKRSRTVRQNGDPCIRIENLTKSFGGLEAVKAVSLNIAQGEHRAILGPNGAGKTTFFNLVAGDLLPTQGNIYFYGEDITRLPCHRRAYRGIARTFQITNLFFNLPVIENMALAVQALEKTKFSLFRSINAYPHLHEKGMELLEQVGLQDVKDEVISNLSYGMQRQIEILMALTREPKLLLLDEPTAGLSPAEAIIMVEMLKKLPSAITMMIIEHDMDVAFELAESITVLHYGKVIAEGSNEEIKANEKVQEIYLGVK
ncbi:MAG: ABC transporter ATP-binding protein [Deltaproteobacteria bacterium]|nr:ABC transporter ATP-binding protein [Deltaproteobacteria bacterium]